MRLSSFTATDHPLQYFTENVNFMRENVEKLGLLPTKENIYFTLKGGLLNFAIMFNLETASRYTLDGTIDDVSIMAKVWKGRFVQCGVPITCLISDRKLSSIKTTPQSFFPKGLETEFRTFVVNNFFLQRNNDYRMVYQNTVIKMDIPSLKPTLFEMLTRNIDQAEKLAYLTNFISRMSHQDQTYSIEELQLHIFGQLISTKTNLRCKFLFNINDAGIGPYLKTFIFLENWHATVINVGDTMQPNPRVSNLKL